MLMLMLMLMFVLMLLLMLFLIINLILMLMLMCVLMPQNKSARSCQPQVPATSPSYRFEPRVQKNAALNSLRFGTTSPRTSGAGCRSS